jgi:large subunit ribosomal protein L25
VDFYEVNAKEEVAFEALVRTIGKADGETFGARIALLRRTIRLTAKPADIPAEITIDVSRMEVDDFIRAGQVKLPTGVTLAIHPDTDILTCAGKRMVLEVDEAVEEAVEEETEGTEEGEQATTEEGGDSE